MRTSDAVAVLRTQHVLIRALLAAAVTAATATRRRELLGRAVGALAIHQAAAEAGLVDGPALLTAPDPRLEHAIADVDCPALPASELTRRVRCLEQAVADHAKVEEGRVAATTARPGERTLRALRLAEDPAVLARVTRQDDAASVGYPRVLERAREVVSGARRELQRSGPQ